VYALFYGGLIQPIQIALGVKRIDNNKVEKTYEQARILVVRILKEGERQAYDACLCDVEKLSMDEISPLVPSPNRLVNWIANKFIDWLDDKIATTTNRMFLVVREL
jgi:hypothetical protein